MGVNVDDAAVLMPGIGRKNFQCHPSGKDRECPPKGLKTAPKALMLNVLYLEIPTK